VDGQGEIEDKFGARDEKKNEKGTVAYQSQELDNSYNKLTK
jgi:hypothetical protein